MCNFHRIKRTHNAVHNTEQYKHAGRMTGNACSNKAHDKKANSQTHHNVRLMRKL